MMKFNDFQKYEATLRIPYEKYFELIYETKYLIEARLSPERCFIATKLFTGAPGEWLLKRQLLGTANT